MKQRFNLLKIKKLITLGTISSALLFLSGCDLMGEGKFTGGGAMNSAGGDKNAIFTFNVKKCDGNDASGRVNFHDRTAIDFETIGGVKLKADITDFGVCELNLDGTDFNCNCEGQYEAHFDYTSSNPGADGTGTGYACFIDTGEGSGNFHGAITAFSLSDGPYDGYFNAGTLNGNVQDHGCPSESE